MEGARTMRSSVLARAIGLLLLAAAVNSASAEDTIPSMDSPHLNPLDSKKLADVKAMIGRPLFAESRRPDQVKTISASVDADKGATAEPEFVLLGVTSGPGGSTARIATSSSTQSRSLRKGEDIDGWKLQAIDVASVTIARAGNIIVLTIFSDGPQQQADESNAVGSDEGIVFSPAEPADPTPTMRVIDRN